MRKFLGFCFLILGVWGLAFAQQSSVTSAYQGAKKTPIKAKKVANSSSESNKKVVQSTPEEPPRAAVEAYAGVLTGKMTCELGQIIRITEDDKQAGNYFVQTSKALYLMAQVSTSTGAVRLEDAKQGAVWLQLPAKSMLMDTRRGQRLADECKSPEQIAVTEQMKQSPPQSLLESQQELAKK
jgi:hypothetical protein